MTVTESNLDYIGSITIDEDLMDAANIIRGERVYNIFKCLGNIYLCDTALAFQQLETPFKSFA